MTVRTGLFAQKITANDRFEFCGVSSFTISNFGASTMQVIISNVATEVLPYDRATMLAPQSFSIDGDGTLTDINIEITFDSGIGDAILYARSAKNI